MILFHKMWGYSEIQLHKVSQSPRWHIKCLVLSQQQSKHKYVQFTVRKDKENLQIFPFEKLKTDILAMNQTFCILINYFFSLFSFLWLPGGLDLHRPALWGYEDRHRPLHEKQREDAAHSQTTCSSDYNIYVYNNCFLSAVRTLTTWAQRSASQRDTSRIYTQTPADSLETAILDPNLWPWWQQVRLKSLLIWAKMIYSAEICHQRSICLSYIMFLSQMTVKVCRLCQKQQLILNSLIFIYINYSLNFKPSHIYYKHFTSSWLLCCKLLCEFLEVLNYSPHVSTLCRSSFEEQFDRSQMLSEPLWDRGQVFTLSLLHSLAGPPRIYLFQKSTKLHNDLISVICINEAPAAKPDVMATHLTPALWTPSVSDLVCLSFMCEKPSDRQEAHWHNNG